MHTRHEDERLIDATPSTPHLTVCVADNAVDAETLLPLPMLTRLCANERLSRARQDNVYRSHVVVALDGDVPVGFAAFKPTAGRVRVAHELWVHAHAAGGPAHVTQALLNALESGAVTAGCSRLCVVLATSSPLRLILGRAGYHVSLSGTDLTWLEKGLVGDANPLESA
jgi:hypothetical protein